MRSIGRERGFQPPTRAQYDEAAGPSGPIFVGDPEAVAEKIVATQRKFRCTRLLLHLALGAIRHAKVMKAIELLGTRVAPLVKQELAASGIGASTTGR